MVPLANRRFGSLSRLINDPWLPSFIGGSKWPFARVMNKDNDMVEDWTEFRVSNDCQDDAEELRRRLADEGYLFFKKLQNPDKLRALRKDMTRIFYDSGWLVAGTDPMDGIADPARRCTEGDLEYNEVYHRIYRLESFHRLPHESELTSVVERIMGRPAIALPGKKARIWFPKFTEHTTPTHQDFVHYQGTFDALTCWSPVGDCPIELGPLAVMPGSHKTKKVLNHHFSLGAGGLIIRVKEVVDEFPELNVPWHTTNFEMGDMLFFPALTIHKAMPNKTEDRLRISLDNRYEGEGDDIAQHMLEPHMNDVSPISWEEVYADWKTDDLKYYWTRVKHRPVPRDLGYIERGFAEAMELARQRDKRGIIALRRVVLSNPASQNAQAAKAVLEEVGVAT
jgi:ectoine hydroxylase-related dioxygenase (phytanoyl-CoA dioxygenase family)